MTEPPTKEDVRRFELKFDDMLQDLKREIRRVGRETLVSLIIITTVLNTITFTAYAIVLRA